MEKTETGEFKNQLYFENLDGLRFLAFLAIFIAHAIYTNDIELAQNTLFANAFFYSKAGVFGIDLFFVLSGFLVAFLSFKELNTTKSFKGFNFLTRRFLRIAPLYLLIVIGTYLFALFPGTGISISELPDFLSFLSFNINNYIARNGPNFLFYLVFLWTISVEVQFYIIWSIIYNYMRKHLVIIYIFFILCSITFRWVYYQEGDEVYFNTISCLGDFFVGALLADFSYRKTKLFKRLSETPGWRIKLFYIALIPAILFYHNLQPNRFFVCLERIVLSGLFACIIFEQCFAENSFFKISSFKTITYLGKISYGLYCFHGIIITSGILVISHFNLDKSLIQVLVISPLIMLGITIGVAALSYTYFEKKFLNLKKRLH